jgi:hypothetical protein
MAKKNMSLTSTTTAYHRIGSPTDPMRVMLDRPLECALCHADKTVEEVTSDMERLFAKRYERETLRALYGALDANVMTSTLARGKPHEQAVALFALGQMRAPGAAPAVARALTHPYPLVREFALGALGAILGRPCDVDLAAEPAQIAEGARKCLELHGIAPAEPNGPGTPDAAGRRPGAEPVGDDGED